MATKRVVTPTSPNAIAIYARVSTQDQNCDLQLTELRAYVSRMGWSPATEYVEKASGKASSKRPVLERLMADARLRRFDCVLVWKMDRFGRSMIHVVSNVDELTAAGVRFLCPSQGIDTDTKSPMGRAMMQMIAVFAEMERALIVERVNAGVKQYAADYKAGRIGKEKHSKSGRDLPSGRPPRIFRRDQAREMRAAGASFRKIAKALGVPVMTVADALK